MVNGHIIKDGLHLWWGVIMAKADGSVYGDGPEVSTNFPKNGGFPESLRQIEECVGWSFFTEPKEVVIDEYCQLLHKTMTEEEIKSWFEEVTTSSLTLDLKSEGYTYLDGLTSPYRIKEFD